MINEPLINWTFPKLKSSGYKEASDATIDYNCIAWAAEDTKRVWWPDDRNIGHWPENITRNTSLKAFIEMFQALGYVVCGHPKHEANFEKVAIYTNDNNEVTHAAKQLPSGAWTSKLGKLEDIEHTLEGISGPDPAYGSVSAIMKRPNLSLATD